MHCPFFQENCVCSLVRPDLYVPPKDVEFTFCRTDDHIRCEVFEKTRRRQGATTSAEANDPTKAGAAAAADSDRKVRVGGEARAAPQSP